MEDDGAIDKSEWVSLAYMEERFQFLKSKGMAVYNRGKLLKTKKAKWPIDRLCEDELVEEPHEDRSVWNPVLNEEQRHAGISFKVLYDCARGKVLITGREGEELQRKDALLRKIAVEEQLTPHAKYNIYRIVIWSHENPFIEEDFKQITQLKNVYMIRNCFDCLIEAMKEENVATRLSNRPVDTEFKQKLENTKKRLDGTVIIGYSSNYSRGIPTSKISQT